MKKALLLFVSLITSLAGIAQITMTEPVPAYGCPNKTHDVTIGVKNTTGVNIPAGFVSNITVTIKDPLGPILKTYSQPYSAAIANGDTAFVTVPNIPFQGAMTCDVDISVNYNFPSPGSYTTSGTYTVQIPQTLIIQESPAGTLTVINALDSYSVRYYKNANYSIVKDESVTGTYTPTSSGNYTAKAYEPISGCKSATASNSITISVTAGIMDGKNTIDVSVYPNPIASSVTISTGHATALSYEILDITGSVLIKADFTSVTNVSVENLKPGSYVLLIKENNERVATYQLVK